MTTPDSSPQLSPAETVALDAAMTLDVSQTATEPQAEAAHAGAAIDAAAMADLLKDLPQRPLPRRGIPMGNLQAYAGPPVVKETVFRSADGKTIIYREPAAGRFPAGHPLFWFSDQVGVKTPRGDMNLPVSGPIAVETLADALAMYDVAVDAAGRAAVKELEAQARRHVLAGGGGAMPPPGAQSPG